VKLRTGLRAWGAAMFQSLKGVRSLWSESRLQLVILQLLFQSLKGVRSLWSFKTHPSLLGFSVFQSLKGVRSLWSLFNLLLGDRVGFCFNP